MYALPPDPDSSQDLVQTGYTAVVHGQWWIVAGVLLSGLHLALRTYGPWKAWLGGAGASDRQRDLRGFLSVALLGLAGGFGHALLVGAPMDLELASAVLKTVAMAVFTYVGTKKVSGAGSSSGAP